MADGFSGINDQFKTRLRLAREARGMSLRSLADDLEAVGITLGKNAIGHIEAGRRAVRLNEAIGIAKVLGTPLDELMGTTMENGNETFLREPVLVVQEGFAQSIEAMIQAKSKYERRSLESGDGPNCRFVDETSMYKDLLRRITRHAFKDLLDSRGSSFPLAINLHWGLVGFHDQMYLLALSLQGEFTTGSWWQRELRAFSAFRDLESSAAKLIGTGKDSLARAMDRIGREVQNEAAGDEMRQDAAQVRFMMAEGATEAEILELVDGLDPDSEEYELVRGGLESFRAPGHLEVHGSNEDEIDDQA